MRELPYAKLLFHVRSRHESKSHGMWSFVEKTKWKFDDKWVDGIVFSRLQRGVLSDPKPEASHLATVWWPLCG